ncbi:thiamine phosphate synthase [Sulfurimonas sp.]|nr:thiamine phosphate synthase [Sulfurimonas sp.]
MKKYLITSNALCEELLIKHSPSYALYRDKTNLDYKTQAESFVHMCNKFESTKSFIHQDMNLAKELNATGVHLTSQQFDSIEDAKQLGIEVIVSTHTYEEVLKAQKLGADAVTYSPIFESPNKGEPKGVKDLENLLKVCDIKVFALGGIIDELHVAMLDKTEVYGFASIRYFMN